MAIYHFSMKPVSRASGRSAVASMAYRAGERLTNERDGITHDFTAKQGVEHAEIVLPESVSADWARDRSDLWNAAEFAEKRKDARVAREFEVALPHELTAEQRLEATRELARELANRYGAAVDFAIHSPHDASDVRNHHAHVMMTTRQVTAEGLGDKTYIERENKWLLANGLPTTDMQLRDLRQTWEGIANEHLARAGHDLRIDHRSHMERGLEIVPTEHMGVHATQMERRGFDVARTRLDEDAARRNADLIREKPEQVLSLITAEKSVFDRHDVARALHRYINDDAQEFQSVFAKVMASPALAELQPERTDPETGEVTLARYSTREMVEIESGMMASAQRLSAARDHGVDRRHVDRAIGAQDAAIQRASGDASARLSDEQRRAIGHITGPERISAVVGFAGAGKSTMLAAAREAWEAEGYRVHGAALSGKAAEGLEESSGIQSRTLASWSRGWENERGQLGRCDVFVIDEAGMIGSRQLARFVGEAEARGAKIVLVGDHEQLQAIGAGAPFRAITEEIGHAELSEIRRQRVDWQRQASVDFATHRTAEGLAAYRDRGDIRFSADRDGARGEIVRDYLADRDARPDGSRVAMAHRRADVRAINDAIRAELQDRGELARASLSGEVEDGSSGARVFQTNDGQREFAPGDRIVFLENNRDLGVKNGMLGTVERVEEGRIIAALDGSGARSVAVPMGDYQAIDHGYATTIHKNQGATVDRAFVMASGTMDRHLTYVAMTRHRDGAQLYAAQDDFTNRHAGRLVEHGAAPFEHKEGNRPSYFVTLENDKGERRTTWGVDLERAMTEAKPEIGEKIGLQHIGATPVTLPDGTETQRNAWKVRDAGELAYEQLERRLSRSGAKETTLDYTRDFAERRGIAESLGIRSEIEVPREALSRDGAEQRPEREAPAELARIEDSPVRFTAEIHKDLAQDLFAYSGLDHGEDQGAGRAERETEKPAPRRRSMFDGLKLNAASRAPAEPGQPEREGGRKVLAPAPDRLAARLRAPTPLEAAVDRYARVFQSVERHMRESLPVLDMQKQELRAAAQQLDQVRGGMKDLMLSTLQHDPQTAQAMTDLSGRERVARVIEGMTRENAALADPQVRAERFVTRWQELQQQHGELYGRYNEEARGKVEAQLNDMADSLADDPQVDDLLYARRQELGLRQEPQREKTVARELQDDMERGHQISRGHGLGL
ncbi:Ti-type conjugative transfer relaxase TraA [Phaeovulum vinaykumarii]|uniref:Ti-type conjugative transfer relaxase TraA n=1 Tax=Phaeovulum vinaykumarii TaxID=407234 RepID=A0A1N7N1Y3_9RHOB|nr:Ti-type conjugative transfer relaxase TraA [Phaeovulum vinaykumarii]SIS92413.1 Ti-type conjugative transfer relaxase TraA [Phaeovulum vinaykumarii]SOC18657.1 Ti-type conjugative transfer relaxase TraA [Phaeovulum vinaykumarii]